MHSKNWIQGCKKLKNWCPFNFLNAFRKLNGVWLSIVWAHDFLALYPFLTKSKPVGKLKTGAFQRFLSRQKRIQRDKVMNGSLQKVIQCFIQEMCHIVIFSRRQRRFFFTTTIRYTPSQNAGFGHNDDLFCTTIFFLIRIQRYTEKESMFSKWCQFFWCV